jgi:prepilin-type processing-associated H-X9-DG protein
MAGVTLVELLVTISLIAMLAALLLPALGMAREAARKASCMNNLASITKAFIAYDAARGQLPGWRNLQDSYSTTVSATNKATACVSWTVTVMPYLGEREIFKWYETYSGPGGVDDATLKRVVPYLCPSAKIELKSDVQMPALSYAVNAGTGATVLNGSGDSARQFRGDGAILDAVGNVSTDSATYVTTAEGSRVAQQYQPGRYSLELLGAADGETCTALIAERTGPLASKEVKWSASPLPAAANAPATAALHAFLQPTSIVSGSAYPLDLKTGRNGWMSRAADAGLRYPSSIHGKGFPMSFCDGHTRVVSEAVDPWVYAQLLSSDQSSRSPAVNQWEMYRLNGTLVHYILDDKDVDKK